MKFRHLQQRVWRLGYRPHPWEWTEWRWAAETSRFNGRWDALDGNTYRTIYAGETLYACLIELLAPFRVDQALAEIYSTIRVSIEDEIDYPSIQPGVLDLKEWLSKRVASTAELNANLCLVTDSATIAALHPLFLSQALTLGLDDFDAAALKNARPRLLTQSVSQYLWLAKKDNGTDLCDGVEFLSRHGDDLKLWAIFERAGDPKISPKLSEIRRESLNRNTPELHQALEDLHITTLEAKR
ncbi:MAG: hypothetical protein WBA28_04010 [Microbacteriaceae bacterium]